MFKNGLKIKIFIKLMCYNIIFKILNNLIKTIIKIDNKFY